MNVTRRPGGNVEWGGALDVRLDQLVALRLELGTRAQPYGSIGVEVFLHASEKSEELFGEVFPR
jgi:hypothetical protein